MEINKKTLRNIFLGVASCIVLYWLLHETERVLAFLGAIIGLISPFIVGASMAFVLNVPMRGIEGLLKGVKKKGPRRVLAVTLTLLAVLLVVTGAVWLILPQVLSTAQTLLSEVPGFITRIGDNINAFLEKNPDIAAWLNESFDFGSKDWSTVIQEGINHISSSLSSMLDQISTVVDQAFGAIVALSNGIFNAVLSFVFGIYCLTRKEILARQGRRILYSLLPEKFCDETVRVLRMTNSAFSNFITGQCLEAVILGLLFAVTMSIFGMPYTPLVSALICVLALIPIVGAVAGCVLGAFFILVDSPVMAFWFVIMFLILQQIEGNLIYPKVVGTSIGLPGMWVLVAVAVGAGTMGIGGMLVMIPLTSVLYALLREFTNKRLEKRGIDPNKLQAQPPELHSGFKQKRKEVKEKLWLKKKKVTEEKPEEKK